ncbi:hypothetical protein [Mucilaginibacter ginsenosidivorax]|uniref:Uncharacterized protein n=1 Tax=Mucilaginibacter ginsenosidivorax TaxID=862126 RepID=A0A5B8W3K6_9SPHI|nr:hypothetical protein [Mucilaginibacter ginsenosidivorax]QEC77466.1 hypothetical protein FSB76_16500 [Mucilaginibacter ginsenosidivorax]
MVSHHAKPILITCTKKELICHPFRALVDVAFVDGRCPSQADVALSGLYYGWQLGTQPGFNFARPERDRYANAGQSPVAITQ